MATVKWLGEEGNPAESCEGWGKTFKKGEAVEVPDDADFLESARNNKFFEVEGGDEPEDETTEEDVKKQETESAAGRSMGTTSWPKI